MDKYTIDLDQLLDDFEYSEFTDQHGGTEKPPNPERLISGRKSSKDLTAKHSINNVFHSLNEYLNTNIASSSDKVIFEEGTSNNAKTDNSSFNTQENFSLESNTILNNSFEEKLDIKNETFVDIEPQNSNFENEGGSQFHIKIEKTEHLLSVSENVSSNPPEPTEIHPECNVNNSICISQKSEQNKTVQVTPEIVNISVNNAETNDDIIITINDNVETNIKLASDNKSNDIKSTDMTGNGNSEENSIIDSDKGVVEPAKPNGETEEYLGLIDNMEHESTEEENSIEAKFADTLIGNDNIALTNQNLEENDIQADDTDTIDNSTVTETDFHDEKNEFDNVCEIRMSESPKVIGFSQDVDVNDSELAKMLEDLEREEDLQPVVNDLQPVGNITTIADDFKTIQEEIEDCENINNLNEEIERTRTQSSDVVHCNDDLNIESHNYETDTCESATICQEVSLEKTESSQKESQLERIENSAVDQGVGNLEASLEANSSLESSQNSDQESKGARPQRPQDLPLNNLKTQEEKARKINLIGSPGSTPYNNVYVNKTGSKRRKNEVEGEKEYSISPSPTFSDVSTDSTSTASTVSIEDIERSKNLAKNVNVEKENNLEKEAIQRLQESRVQGAGDSQENDNRQTVSNDVIETTQNMQNEETIPPTDSVQGGTTHSGGGEQWAGPYSDKAWLGKEAPLWIPDADTSACLHCDVKFTMIKRRHHCRACGLVLCAKCCNLKFRLEYLDAEARVCQKCFGILSANQEGVPTQGDTSSGHTGGSPSFRPNPNNPSEYCSTVSPLQQAEHNAGGSNPPSVMVPVGVLKRKGSNKSKHNKSVMFCDGIAPGSDLTNLDKDFDYHESKNVQKPELKSPKKDEVTTETSKRTSPAKIVSNYPKVYDETKCFIPNEDSGLPPIVDLEKVLVANAKPESIYTECNNSKILTERLKNETVCFAITTQLFVNVRIINMNCCINKMAWCFSSEGLINVGNDEIVYLLEYIENENCVPKDIFFHIHNIYLDAMQGNAVKELGLSLHNAQNFLDSKNHAGFVYIKPTFQCLENMIKPKDPCFLVGILIHRWETPWAKIFPLRLILRLGAEYRYYPSPIISTRHRDSVFVEIGHTIINLLADFRNYSYTLPQIRGLIIHMEDKNTTITIPINRYDQVMKAMSTAPDHILAFAGNFSPQADSHLVCIQDTQGNENNYTTHAINIHNKPRKITGASFIIFNGSLKSTIGNAAKSNIIEDGLMIQILPEHMIRIRDSLRSMKDHTIACTSTESAPEETVKIAWGENDVNFNVEINSPVDLMDMKGVPSIRVHNGKEYVSSTGTRVIRWTEVFIIQNSEEDSKNQDPVDISKVSESIAKASCTALVSYLELLLSNSYSKIGIRVTLQADNVSYLAGSNGKTLPPIYMKSLDDELIPILHKITSNRLGDHVIVLELIFRILFA